MTEHIPTIHLNHEPDRFNYHVTCSCGWRQAEMSGEDDSRAALASACIEHFNAYRGGTDD